MGAVLVNNDFATHFASHISAYVAATLYDQHFVTQLIGTICRYGSEQAAADNQIVVCMGLFHLESWACKV